MKKKTEATSKRPVKVDEKRATVSRRELVVRLAHAGAGAMAVAMIGRGASAPQGVADLPGLPEPTPGEDSLIRMSRDLRRALAKPMAQRRWVMVIDTRKCTGCHACTVGCMAENKLPPGVVYRPVREGESGTYPDVKLTFFPRPCMQCSKPPCVAVCPVKATWKKPDGIVTIDYDKCIGCGRCVARCPYGARSLDDGSYHSEGAPKLAEYDTAPIYEYGKERVRRGDSAPINKARKCHFCLHRLEKGLLPICTSTCMGRATYFGDANDPESLVSELIRNEKTWHHLPEKETQPNVFYIS